MQVGEWTVEADRDRIVRGSESVKLEHRATAVLLHLAEHAGKVVSKDDLIDAVWNGNAVSDHSVAIVISDLRKSLGDDRREARFIETIPKRGYRLIAPVRSAASGDEPPAKKRFKLALAALIPVAALGAVAVATARGDQAPYPSLIVADVSNDSGSPAAERLAYALPELLVANLGQYPRGPLVRLRGKSALSGAPADSAMLSGRIARDGQGYTAFVSLKRLEDGRILWSDSYPVSDANIASSARDIAGSAAVALGATLRGPPAASNASVASQALYWEARRLAETRDETGYRAARAKLIQALQQSPNFAAAHSALANIYAHKSGEHLGLPRLDTFSEAEHHLRIAEQLGAPTAETAITRTLISVFRDRDLDAAIAQARRAVALEPSNAESWQSLAMVSSIRGDDRTALQSIDKAIAIEPSRRDLLSDRVWMLYVAGRTAEARNEAFRLPDRGTMMSLYRALIETRRGDKASAFNFWVERARRRGLDEQSIQTAVTLSSTDIDRAYRSLASAVASTDAYDENEVALAAMYRAGGDSADAARTLSALRRNRDNWLWLWLDRLPELRNA